MNIHYLEKNLWYRNSLISYLLVPFSLIYWIIITIRRFLYQKRWLKQTKFPIPIIIVGNLTVGGTGKTPLTIWLANFLKEQGLNSGIVTRGYGSRRIKHPIIIDHSNVSPKDSFKCGDEAILLAQKTRGPVAISPNRVQAVEALLAKHNCQVIISDDGLQHYALARTLEIAVIDNSRGFGNGFLLPAGPLRESRKRLNEVDLIIFNQTNLPSSIGVSRCDEAQSQKSEPSLRGVYDEAIQKTNTDCHVNPALAGLTRNDIIAKSQSCPRSRSRIERRMVYTFAYQTNLTCNLKNPALHKNLEDWKGLEAHAVAAIGNPNGFFKMLANLGIIIIPHEFRDHYVFKAEDLEFNDNLPILMTEKDAVKCETFAKTNWWYVPIEIQFAKDSNFSQTILEKLSP